METVKPINFTNFSNEDFVGVYSKKQYRIPKEKTLLLPAELACHFAKHLVNRELHKLGLQVNDPVKYELLPKVSDELEWSKKKHLVVIKTGLAQEGGDVVLEEAEAAVQAKQVEKVPEEIQAPEPAPVETTTSSTDEEVDLPKEVEPPEPEPASEPSLEDLTRKELDKKAVEEYGCDSELVKKAKSKAQVVTLMEEKAKEAQGEEKSDEEGFEGNK